MNATPDLMPILQQEVFALEAEVERLEAKNASIASDRDALYTQHRLAYERAERLEAEVERLRELLGDDKEES